MKRLILVAFLPFVALFANAQSSVFIGLYGGGGLVTSNNYNVSISAGLDFFKAINEHTAIGANLFYQGYNIYYDNEAYGVKGGTGNAGVTLLDQCGYVFITPKLVRDVDHRGILKFNLSAGAGFKMSGTETMRKWDFSNGGGAGSYDSLINSSKNLNSMLIRVGFGFTEFLSMRGHWSFTVSEDFGFIGSSVTKTSDVTDGSRTQYSPNKLNPGCISLQIGIMHHNGG